MTSELGLVSKVTAGTAISSSDRGPGIVLTLHTNHHKQSRDTERQHQTILQMTLRLRKLKGFAQSHKL